MYYIKKKQRDIRNAHTHRQMIYRERDRKIDERETQL